MTLNLYNCQEDFVHLLKKRHITQYPIVNFVTNDILRNFRIGAVRNKLDIMYFISSHHSLIVRRSSLQRQAQEKSPPLRAAPDRLSLLKIKIQKNALQSRKISQFPQSQGIFYRFPGNIRFNIFLSPAPQFPRTTMQKGHASLPAPWGG